MIDLVDQKETKLSIETIHLMKSFIDIMVEQTIKNNKLKRNQYIEK